MSKIGLRVVLVSADEAPIERVVAAINPMDWYGKCAFSLAPAHATSSMEGLSPPEILGLIKANAEAVYCEGRAMIGTTKICINGNCPSYARVIYTGATRCDFCRWDLKAAQRNVAPAAHADSAPPQHAVLASRAETSRHGNV